MLLYHPFSCFLHVRRAFRKLVADEQGELAQGLQELGPCEDRGSGNGDVALGFRFLDQLNASSLFEKSVPDKFFLSKFVCQDEVHITSFFQQILHRAGVPPCEQLVQRLESLVENVVFLGGNFYDIISAYFFDFRCHFLGSRVKNIFRIPDFQCSQFLLCQIININSSDNEIAEIVALPGLVDADVRHGYILFQAVNKSIDYFLPGALLE